MATFVLEPEFFVDLDGTIKTGSIVIEGDSVTSFSDGPAHATKIMLRNQVVMPGFVNCHSHAFQRVLRGLVEKKSHAQDDFWSWREKMYAIAQKVTHDDLENIAQLAFIEMLEAGFTNVAEFHYLHHESAHSPSPDPHAMSRAISQAAQRSGINVCLLETAYQRYDFSKPLAAEQRRFGFHEITDFLAFVAQAKAQLTSAYVDVGLAIHSVRAVFEESLLPLATFAEQNFMPLHVHASEQISEVTSCLKAHDRSPIALLNDARVLTPRTTLVHATHLIRNDLDIIAASGASVCICPSTEKNLGDGVVALCDLFDRNISVCIGSDQNVRLDPFSEARSLEEQERLRIRKRNVLTKPGEHLYQTLLPGLTLNGLKSINKPSSSKTMLSGPANLVSIELPLEYEWHGSEAALDAMMVSYNSSKIRTVITNGHFVVQDGVHKFHDKIRLVDEIKTFFKKLNSSAF